MATLVTVIVSIIAHGFSAAPLAQRYAAWAQRMPPEAPELADEAEIPGPMPSDSSEHRD